MLSRIAESMFWIGRYVERADNTARMVQTQLRLIAEDTSRGEADSCRNLLALMSVDGDDHPEPTAADLLEPTTQAHPERVDELLKRSEPRGLDRFDLPPSGAAAAPPVAGSDPGEEDPNRLAQPQ